MKFFSIFIVCFVFLTIGFSNDYIGIMNLTGEWKFTTGDNPDYSHIDFDDSEWGDIFVPLEWESAGYPGYDGFAWYRKTFMMDSIYTNKELLIELAKIDDVDEVFINGQLIGSSGSFPPDYKTAWSENRSYTIPKEIITEGENVLAVRVYDDNGPGGIKWHDVWLFVNKKEILNTVVDLSGNWKFSDQMENDWKSLSFNDQQWEDMAVPGHWESYDKYKKLDEDAYYRKVVELSDDNLSEELILVLGKIDDIDEVFINGKKIGATGNFNNERYWSNNMFLQERYYYIPKHLLHSGDNIIAIHVYDRGGYGGIYEGPVSIVTRRSYLNYCQSSGKNHNGYTFGEVN